MGSGTVPNQFYSTFRYRVTDPLDAGLNVRVADFGGASLDGSEPSATPATRFRHPGYDWNIPPVVGDDIFSLGSLVYFIMELSVWGCV